MAKGKRTWIAGIFKNRETAKDYFEKISKASNEKKVLLAIPLSKYPFYVIEETNTFKYVEKKDLLSSIEKIVPGEDDDVLYFNFYIIDTDFTPEDPGKDFMGVLNHYHVDNDFLNNHEEELKHL